jgi:hypothetical protein
MGRSRGHVWRRAGHGRRGFAPIPHLRGSKLHAETQSPTRMSISAAVPVEIPWASSMAGAQDTVKASRLTSWTLISASSVSQRHASARKAALAEAAAERMGPGLRAARCRISAILPMMRSSAWRKAAGALMMMVLSVTMACVRLFTAVSRATFRCRIISTLSADLGRTFA